MRKMMYMTQTMTKMPVKGGMLESDVVQEEVGAKGSGKEDM